MFMMIAAICKPCAPATARGCSTASAPRIRTCPATSSCAWPARQRRRQLEQSLPAGVYQGCHINLPIDYDARTVLPYLQNQHLSPGAQRGSSISSSGSTPCKPSGAATTAMLDARVASLEMAFRMQTAAQEAFDLTQETRKDERVVRLRSPESQHLQHELPARAPARRARRPGRADLHGQQASLGTRMATTTASIASSPPTPSAASLPSCKT